MARRDSYSSPTDPTTPCDECGGGTYTFPSGSVWCPMNTPLHSTDGGHFVKRVQPSDHVMAKRNRDISRVTDAPARPVARPVTPSVSAPKPVAAPANEYGGGYDDFVKGE